MAEHNDSGKLEEQFAADWLVGKGYELMDANYRRGHSGIDLVLTHRGLLIFVEVKFRSGTGFGFAEEFVDATKRKLLIKAADHYIDENNWHKEIRFDIIGVNKHRTGEINFRHFEDAFY